MSCQKKRALGHLQYHIGMCEITELVPSNVGGWKTRGVFHGFSTSISCGIFQQTMFDYQRLCPYTVMSSWYY